MIKRIVGYFREVLVTLKEIESHLESLSGCVVDRGDKHGDKHTISTKHWND